MIEENPRTMRLHRHIQATDSRITLVLKEDLSIRVHTNPVRQDRRGQAQGPVKGRATNPQNTLGFQCEVLLRSKDCYLGGLEEAKGRLQGSFDGIVRSSLRVAKRIPIQGPS